MSVHWWSADRAVERLAKDGVSESESLHYAIASGALYSFAMYYSIWFGGDRTWLLLFELCVIALIAVVGIQEAFKANGGTGGSEFLKRLTVISVPVGVKLTIISVVWAQLSYYGFPFVVTHESFRNPEHAYRLFCFAFAVTFQLVYYWQITQHFSRLRKLLKSSR